MASATRHFARAATRTATRNTFAVAPRQAFRQQGRRWYSSEPAQKSSSSTWLYLTGAAAVGGLGYWYYTASGAPSAASTKVVNPTKEDYQKVYNEIAARLEEKDDYDDGSFGPVLLRLAWHASGTFDKATGTGGSNGATMRFAPESDHGANAGLIAARDFLQPVKGKSVACPAALAFHGQRRVPHKPAVTDFVSRSQVPLDHLLRPLDPRRRLRHPGDAGPHRPLPPRPL